MEWPSRLQPTDPIPLIKRLPMPLSSEQRRQYRALAHELKPVVMIGDNGVSDGLHKELERALDDHELIKVKVSASDREERREAIEQACELTGAELVQTIGKVAILLRRAKDPNPKLSNLRSNG